MIDNNLYSNNYYSGENFVPNEQNSRAFNEINFQTNVVQNDNDINNIMNNNINLNVKSNKNSAPIISALDKIKFLSQENAYLKKVISDKDKIISDFTELFEQSREKFIKLQKANIFLKNKLQNMNINNFEVDIDNNNDQDNLLLSFKEIKKDLIKIEKDYYVNLEEKNHIIENMEKEMIHIYNEYKNLSMVIEKMNESVINSNYSESNNMIKNLMQEKSKLIQKIKQNEKVIKELEIKNQENENIIASDNQELLFNVKNQENKYVKTINLLQNRIIDKDKEIQMIKEAYNKILNEKEN